MAWLALCLFSGSLLAQGDSWEIRKTEWSTVDEKNYQAFIRSLGYVAFEKRCNTADGVCKGIVDLLESEGNIYRQTDPDWVKTLHTDCADFPLTLRAYFAWKNNLPHAVAHGVAPVGYCGTVADTRFCQNGNKVVSRRAVATGVSAKDVIRKWSVSPTTSVFRTHYLDEHGIGSDFYTPQIDRNGIVPGTIVYDPNGHTTMVFDVLDDGRMLFLEAEISGEIDAGYLTASKIPIKPDVQGWGFKNWKPVKLVDADLDASGYYIGGKTVVPRATEVPGYSPEQYAGRLHGTEDQYRLNGQTLSYHDFVRYRLAGGAVQTDPVRDIRQLVESVCRSVQGRVSAVDQAILVGMDKDPHPERLPPNIYGTGGHWQWFHWESYSSPSRDAHIKTELKSIADVARDLMRRYRVGDQRLAYSGNNLAADMLEAYIEAGRQCDVTYTNSNNEPVRLDLLDITNRAFRLSFDPYHCVELRWGAEGEELASCGSDANKLRWYANQQYLRNQIERRYDDRMDFAVDELAVLQPGNGVAEPPDIDVIRFLESQLSEQVAAQ